MPRDEQACWDGRYTERPASWIEPDEFLQKAWSEFLSALPPGRALDLAGGAGRNSAFLIERGWQVTLIDISPVGIGLARDKGAALGSPQALDARHLDLNTISDLGSELYDLIVVFFFLRRELFPAIARALKPGGYLVYKTHTVEQMKLKTGPRHADHLLEHNELLGAFQSLHVLHYEERIAERATAELIARK